MPLAMPTAMEILEKDLNPTQKEIVQHIFRCDGEDNSAHIAAATDVQKAQPHVFRSCKDLEVRGYLRSEKGTGKKETLFRLTRKGLGVAYLLNQDYNLLVSYSKRHFQQDYHELVELTKYIDSLSHRQFFLAKYYEYAYQNDLFGRNLTPQEVNNFRAWIALQGLQELGGAESLQDMKKRYGITNQTIEESIKHAEKKIKLIKKGMKDI